MNQNNKYKKISMVLWIILVANILVAMIKIVIGYTFRVNSLSADGFHAITDSVSNIIGLIGIHFASKPADDKHPYGHQKIETICGFMIGFMLLGITIQIINNSINWFKNPSNPIVNIPSLIALIITLFINIFIATIEYKKGKDLNSDILVSDSIHTRSDIFISTGVIITMILIRLGVPSFIDPIVSIIIALLILKSCVEIFVSAINVLVDKKVIDENRIIEIVQSVDEVILNVHKVRSRGRMDSIYIDFHVILEGGTSIIDAHNLSHRIEKKLQEELKMNVEVLTHIEPNYYKVNGG